MELLEKREDLRSQIKAFWQSGITWTDKERAVSERLNKIHKQIIEIELLDESKLNERIGFSVCGWSERHGYFRNKRFLADNLEAAKKEFEAAKKESDIFNMRQKELDKEGITKEFLSKLSINNLGSPVQLLPNDEPVKLVKCSTGFWVAIDGEILRDKDNSYLVISNKEALIGRARYLLNFQDEILQHKIDSEIKRLKKVTDKALDEALDKLRGCLVYAGKIDPVGFEAIAHSIMKGDSSLAVDTVDYNNKVEAAKEIADENTQELYNKLLHQKELEENKDYSSLYSFLIQKGITEIASFDMNNQTEMNALTKFFHKDSLEKTIIEIKSSDHIYNVAKFNVEKTNISQNV